MLDRHGLRRAVEIAGRLGVDQSLVWRVRTGRCRPGAAFVAGVLAAFPEVRFEDVFTVERGE